MLVPASSISAGCRSSESNSCEATPRPARNRAPCGSRSNQQHSTAVFRQRGAQIDRSRWSCRRRPSGCTPRSRSRGRGWSAGCGVRNGPPRAARWSPRSASETGPGGAADSRPEQSAAEGRRAVRRRAVRQRVGRAGVRCGPRRPRSMRAPRSIRPRRAGPAGPADAAEPSRWNVSPGQDSAIRATTNGCSGPRGAPAAAIQAASSGSVIGSATPACACRGRHRRRPCPGTRPEGLAQPMRARPLPPTRPARPAWMTRLPPTRPPVPRNARRTDGVQGVVARPRGRVASVSATVAVSKPCPSKDGQLGEGGLARHVESRYRACPAATCRSGCVQAPGWTDPRTHCVTTTTTTPREVAASMAARNAGSSEGPLPAP